MLKLLLLLFLIISYCHSHPHTFMEVYPSIEVKNNIIKKIHFKWEMDEMTSSMLIMEFDINNNGKIDSEENSYINKNYFISLKDYSFYTNIIINNKIQKFPMPKNFKASIQNNKIIYSFDIDVDYNIKDLRFDFADEDFFVAMILKKEFVNVKGAKIEVSDLDKDFYFGYSLEFN